MVHQKQEKHKCSIYFVEYKSWKDKAVFTWFLSNRFWLVESRNLSALIGFSRQKTQLQLCWSFPPQQQVVPQEVLKEYRSFEFISEKLTSIDFWSLFSMLYNFTWTSCLRSYFSSRCHRLMLMRKSNKALKKWVRNLNDDTVPYINLQILNDELSAETTNGSRVHKIYRIICSTHKLAAKIVFIIP